MILHLTDLPFQVVAVMVHFPFFIPLTFPLEVTVATFLLLLFHVTVFRSVFAGFHVLTNSVVVLLAFTETGTRFGSGRFQLVLRGALKHSDDCC